MRAGLFRNVVNRYVYAGDLFVGRLVTVATPDPLAGLIVWVTVEPSLRGKGFGAAVHAAVQQDLGIPLLLDMAVDTAAQAVVAGLSPCVKKHANYPSWGWFQDKVEPTEYLVWDAMARSKDWYVRCFDGRFLAADFEPCCPNYTVRVL
jgi:GNAT superfamily N-acetyltransferase